MFIKDRNSNFELLRIMAMVMIVAHHFSIYGNFKFSADYITINRVWIQFIQIGGKIGVDIFVLISGYFLVNVEKMKMDRMLKYWSQLIFYSISLYFLCVALGVIVFDYKTMIVCLFPILSRQWWFASTYFVLYLMSPFLNILLKQLSREKYLKMLLLMTVCWCIIPTFFSTSFESNDLIWFMYLYAVSGYIRIWQKEIKLRITSKKAFGMAIAVLLIMYMIVIVFDLLGIRVDFFVDKYVHFYNQNQLPILLISLMVFIGFKNLSLKNNRIINCISMATFGVYLIHDNASVRLFLWNGIFRSADYSESVFLIPYSLGVIMLVFICCTIMDLVRSIFLEKLYLGFYNKLVTWLNKIIEKIIKKYVIKNI